jgi:autotransporter translocation and assembly factor TamB
MKYVIRQLTVALIALSAAFALYAAESVDASGTWQFTIQDTGRVFTPSFTLTQQGDQLTGTYKNSQGDNAANGSVKGSEVTLNAQITGQDGNKRTVTYVGTIAGDTMTGKMQTTRADVTFVAKREAKK